MLNERSPKPQSKARSRPDAAPTDAAQAETVQSGVAHPAAAQTAPAQSSGSPLGSAPRNTTQPGMAQSAGTSPTGTRQARHWIRNRWGVLCWFGVLLLIGCVQLIRAQWFDAAILFVFAVVMLLQLRGAEPSRTNVRASAPWRLPLGVLSAFACLLFLLPRHGLAIQLVMLALLAFVCWAALSGRMTASPNSPTSFSRGARRLAGWWAGILIIGCLWELFQFLESQLEPDADWFSLSQILDPALSSKLGVAGFVLVWLAGGFFLLRRGGAR